METLADVANLLEVPHDYLTRLLTTRHQRGAYSQFSIPKKAGGSRIIDSPPKPLRILQEKLNYVLQLVYRPKPAVHGFVQNRSIRSNASAHVQRRWVLNIDLEDFFPSIHFGRVRGAFMASPFALHRAAATALAQICTRADGVLPQGAPTSPFVSNIVCARLDGQLMALAKKHGLTYTRYCDDITLSSRQKEFPSTIAAASFGWLGSGVAIGESLEQLMSGNGFRVNHAKSRLQVRGSHQEVTGVTVNQFPNVSRAYVRALRGMIFAWRKHGVSLAAEEFGRRTGRRFDNPATRDAHFKSVVRGRLEHVGYIRGRRDPVYCALRRALHLIAPETIGPAPTPDRYRMHPPTANGDRWARLYESRQKGIALLEIDSGQGDLSMGSAFAVSAGELITAAHNMKGAISVAAPVPSPLPVSIAHFHTRGKKTVDAALIPLVHGLPELQSDRRDAIVGESIAVLGFATVPQRQPTLGIYPGTVESVSTDYAGATQFIQISVQASGGLSGSPMFDTHGRVLGVVVESSFEATEEGVPSREFLTVLPIRYALEIRQDPVPESMT